MSASSGPTVTCPKCKQGQMVKLPTGWTCNNCGYAPFAPKAGAEGPIIGVPAPSTPSPTPPPTPPPASSPEVATAASPPAEDASNIPDASAPPPPDLGPSSPSTQAPPSFSTPSISPFPDLSTAAPLAASSPPAYPSLASTPAPAPASAPAFPEPPAPAPPPSFAPSPYTSSYPSAPPTPSPPPTPPAPGPYVAPSRTGFSYRPAAAAPPPAGSYTPIYSAGSAPSAAPAAPAAVLAPPAPSPVAPPPPSPPAPSSSLHNPVAPSRSLYPYAERQTVYDMMPWRPAGGGLRFSRDVPLRTLPPGEPIYVEMMVHNQGATPLAVTYYIFLTNANLQGTKLQGESMDIPPGSVLDVSHTLAANLQLGDYAITVFCVPRTMLGRPQDPNVFPTLAPVEGALPAGLPSLYEVLKIRREVACPSCQGRLLWTPAGMGGRVRAWVCGRCGNRIENGVV